MATHLTVYTSESAPMDRSGFPLSSTHRAREQDTCTSTPNDILHDSAARAKYTRTRTEFVWPQSLLWLVKWVNAHSLIDRPDRFFLAW